MHKDTLWNNKDVSLGSRVTVESQTPNPRRKRRPSLLWGPWVLTAIYAKSWTALIDWHVLDVSERLGSFWCCTWSVFGDLTMSCYQGVWTRNLHVTYLPIFQGTKVIPFGLFLSLKNKHVGSLEARKIMPFSILCLLVRQSLLLQRQTMNAFTPSLKPVATRTASSSSLRLQNETDMTFKQFPLCGACETRRRALLMSYEQDSGRVCRVCWYTTGI